MYGLNLAIAAGNLTWDPEMRYTAEGMAVTRFGIAVNKRWKDKKDGTTKEDVTYINVDCFGGTAEFVEQHIHKGDPVVIVGEGRIRSWTAEGETKKRFSYKIAATRVIALIGHKAVDQGPDPAEQAGTEEAHRQEEEAATPGEQEDIPF